MAGQSFRLPDFAPKSGADIHAEGFWPDDKTTQTVDVYTYVGYKDFPVEKLPQMEKNWVAYLQAQLDLTNPTPVPPTPLPGPTPPPPLP